MTDLTPASAAVLAVVDTHGAAAIAGRTDRDAKTVNGSAAHALIRRGVLEAFNDDGRAFVRRPIDYWREDFAA